MLLNPETLEMPDVGTLFPTTRRRRHVKPCGTAAAYRRHFRRKGRELPVDPACAAWHRKDVRARARRKP
jgi:hypothetical protein